MSNYKYEFGVYCEPFNDVEFMVNIQTDENTPTEVINILKNINENNFWDIEWSKLPTEQLKPYIEVELAINWNELNYETHSAFYVPNPIDFRRNLTVQNTIDETAQYIIQDLKDLDKIKINPFRHILLQESLEYKIKEKTQHTDAVYVPIWEFKNLHEEVIGLASTNLTFYIDKDHDNIGLHYLGIKDIEALDKESLEAEHMKLQEILLKYIEYQDVLPHNIHLSKFQCNKINFHDSLGNDVSDEIVFDVVISFDLEKTSLQQLYDIQQTLGSILSNKYIYDENNQEITKKLYDVNEIKERKELLENLAKDFDFKLPNAPSMALK